MRILGLNEKQVKLEYILMGFYCEYVYLYTDKNDQMFTLFW